VRRYSDRVAGIAGRVDDTVTEAVIRLRFDAATDVFTFASSTWRWSLLVALAVGLALHARRVPAAPLWAGAAALVTSLLTNVLKDAFDRPRPSLSDPDITALASLPDSAAMPSGHAATAFAAAAVVSVFHPRLAVPALATAAIVALSRVYLGVHWAGDVLAGAVLGIAIGLAVAWVARRVLGRPRTPAAQHT
jgi:undecaprenyl-diphosphatase